MKRVNYTFHLALVVLCILSLYATRTQGFNYVVPILGEPIGEDETQYEQLVSVARLAASQVSSTWSTDTLRVQPYFQANSPVEVVNIFHEVAENTSVITTMVPEAETRLGATLSLLSSSLNVRSVNCKRLPSTYQFAVEGTSPTFSPHAPPPCVSTGKRRPPLS